MTAVFKHELRSYFHSLTAYVFGAFLLLVVGFGAMFYNIQAAVSNFEYVLSFSSLVFVVIVPILTMRVIAEERRQKTDQLLYSLPITTTQVILGKYLALLVVYLVPLCVISLYPLIFAQFGEVYLLTSYGSILAFFILGAALIAVGVFLSSLTENQGFAAGMGVAVILLNYYSVSLAEYTSSTAFGSLVALYVLTALLGLVIRYLTRNDTLAYGVSLVLIVGLAAAYFLDSTRFEGLLPRLMEQLSLFDRFTGFVNGVFDLASIVYYLSVAGFFLFLSVQSLEKRRYSTMDSQRYVSTGDGNVYLAVSDPLDYYDAQLSDLIENDETPYPTQVTALSFAGSQDYAVSYQAEGGPTRTSTSPRRTGTPCPWTPTGWRAMWTPSATSPSPTM